MCDGCDDNVFFNHSIYNSEWETVDKSPPQVTNNYTSGLGVFCDSIQRYFDLVNKRLTKAELLRLVKGRSGCEFLRGFREELYLNHPILFRISAITSLAGRASVSPAS